MAAIKELPWISEDIFLLLIASMFIFFVRIRPLKIEKGLREENVGGLGGLIAPLFFFFTKLRQISFFFFAC